MTRSIIQMFMHIVCKNTWLIDTTFVTLFQVQVIDIVSAIFYIQLSPTIFEQYIITFKAGL